MEHRTALNKIAEVGQEKWCRAYTFAFVRNPWDKVVSHFHYRIKTNQTTLRENSIGFRDWVQLTYGQQDPNYYDKPKMFMPQSDWITDSDGLVLVDFVGRFENLNEDFSSVCKQLGKNVTLPHVKSSQRKRDYREYYDDLTIEIVEQWFSKDIDRFGYRF